MSFQVIVRPYQFGDENHIHNLLSEATMSTVWPVFLSTARRELVLQLIVIVTAALFVVWGWPLSHSMMTFPVFFTTLYLVIWIGHKVKAVAMHTDLANIDQHYMSDSRCGFWVAQVTDRGWTDPSTVASIPLDASARVYEQTLVGTVAVAIKEDTPNEPPESVAWLRRMSVSKSFQRLGIGTTLADVALEHCARANFRAVELLTTEHHHQGRSLYVSKGFELMETQSKQYLGGLIHFALLRFRLPCTLMRSSLNA